MKYWLSAMLSSANNSEIIPEKRQKGVSDMYMYRISAFTIHFKFCDIFISEH